LIDAFRLFAPWRQPGDATGAIRRGRRWNSPGTAILYAAYAASSLSLACLEVLVHLRHIENIPPYSYAGISIPNSEIEDWGKPNDWTQAILESDVLSREIGDNWIEQSRKAVLQVPSAVIPQEWNYLIEPSAGLRWSDPKPFRIDPRLIDPSLR
jgi:RES domain-containing protein